MNPNELAAEVGKALRGWREARGIRQDEVARAARQVGLPWTRSVVVALEAERRYLTIDEFKRLPRLLELLGAPPGEPEARLECHGALAQIEVVPLLRSKAQRINMVVPVEMVPALQYEDESTKYAAYRAAGGDLEQKVARRFRMDPLVVALVALKAWGRSLSEERDRRVAEQVAAGTSARAIQALRGHVTRALRKELDPQLATTRQRLRRKKGARR
jgi:transcriptional regulator with XRE-family HTH domain